MKTTRTLLATIILSTGLLTATGANAALVSALGGQVVNDTDLNVTWLSNANLAATNSFGLARNVDLGAIPGVNTYGGSYIYNNGTMSWGGAMKWIAAMNASNGGAGYLGYNNWRLPTSNTCSGYNCTGSEMGHLFLSELGGAAMQPLSSSTDPDKAKFTNLMSDIYWSGTEYAPDTSGGAWYFATADGGQDASLKDLNMFAMAVRPGQVAAVPEAESWAMLLAGLGLIGVAVGRRR